jgi:energy-coupling factor transporter transmembrane protein EcfT
MSFFQYKSKLNPLIALAAAIALIVFGLVMARTPACSYFLLAVYVWLFFFGCSKQCLRILPAFVIVGGVFGAIAYFAYGSDFSAAVAMVNRFAAIFLAAIIGSSVEAVSVTRSLSELHTPRCITLGMLIATSFVPVLTGEIKRVREAMKTRGAGSVLSPKVFYRAFLVPLVMRLVGISDTLSLSVETRGFTLGKAKYTVYKREIVALSDIVFLLALVAGAVPVVVL